MDLQTRCYPPSRLPDVRGRHLSIRLSGGCAALLRVVAVLKARHIAVEDLRYSTSSTGTRLDLTAIIGAEGAQRLTLQLSRIIDVLEVS